jgi:hypothetical protein
MVRRWGLMTAAAVAAAALVLGTPALARQGAVPQEPTAKDPIRFSAFGVSMQAGISGAIQIAIERWTTDDERTALLNTMAKGGQNALLNALQDVKVRTGFIRTSNSMGYDLRYCRDNILPDGSRQIVIATDKPVSFLAASRQTRNMDYPFTFVEMRFAKGSLKGEGKMLAQTALSVKNGRLELENYGQEPVRLTTITQQVDKKK